MIRTELRPSSPGFMRLVGDTGGIIRCSGARHADASRRPPRPGLRGPAARSVNIAHP
jgi:hypothetical protein